MIAVAPTERPICDAIFAAGSFPAKLLSAAMSWSLQRLCIAFSYAQRVLHDDDPKVEIDRIERGREHTMFPAGNELAPVRLVPNALVSGVHGRLGEKVMMLARSDRVTKVIFLDIDGVLNCQKTSNPRDLPYIVDDRLLARFRKLLDQTGASVVLSSTWRYDPAGIFSAKHYGIPLIDVTPDRPHEPRCKEILEWLKSHPEVTRFLVLDDEDDGLDSLPLFQPSSRMGLTEEIVEGATDYLDGKTDKDMRHGRIVRAVQNLHSIFKGHPG